MYPRGNQSRSRAAPGFGEKLTPHVQIGPRKIGRRRAPAMGQSMISCHCVAPEGEVETIEEFCDHPVAEGWILQVGRQDDHVAIGIDTDVQCVTKVRIR